MERRYPLRMRLFRAICTQPTQAPDEYSDLRGAESYEEGFASDERFFSRLPELSFAGKTVLDYGCGLGQTCIHVAKRGAVRVVGVDIQDIDLPRRKLAEDYPELTGVIELRQVHAGESWGDEKFDIVISKNTFEHVGDPDRYVGDMLDHLAPGGELVIGFAPPWKAPHGGHIGYMTKVPWAHLMFPEQVILRERKRYRPDEDPARLDDVLGGLNRMTLERFRGVMAASGLEASSFATNRHEHPAVKVISAVSRIPGLKEYFTVSVHSVWRRPGEASRQAGQEARREPTGRFTPAPVHTREKSGTPSSRIA
jgi:SAM-dependent methyltransferase